MADPPSIPAGNLSGPVELDTSGGSSDGHAHAHLQHGFPHSRSAHLVDRAFTMRSLTCRASAIPWSISGVDHGFAMRPFAAVSCAIRPTLPKVTVPIPSGPDRTTGGSRSLT